jgi:hypothetical protein
VSVPRLGPAAMVAAEAVVDPGPWGMAFLSTITSPLAFTGGVTLERISTYFSANDIAVNWFLAWPAWVSEVVNR